MTRSPMKTITAANTGAFSTGRMISRSITTPPAKEAAIVMKKAAQ